MSDGVKKGYDMNYSELKRTVERKGIHLWCTHTVNLNAMTGTLICDWHGNIGGKYEYKLKLSPEYVNMCKKIDALTLDGVRFEDKGDYLIAHPAYVFESNGWGFMSSTYRMNRYCTSNRTHVFYNNELLEIDSSEVPYYFRSSWMNPEAFVCMWKDNLVYRSYDSIFMISKDGVVKFVSSYPAESESGRINLTVKDGILKVSEFVYYDESHHHGGWEHDDIDLNKIA